MDYASLAALAAVAREGSFEGAAKLLGVTPSAVSQRVKGLEERLGAVLIVRGQPCVPTPLGLRICAHAEQVQLLEGELAAAIPALAEGRTAGMPTLRVAVNADSLASWFIGAVARFSTAHDALLDIVREDEGHTADRLRSGEVIAAVTTENREVQGCRVIPLGALRYVAVASPAFMGRYFAGGVDGKALNAAPVMRYDKRDNLQAKWAKAARGVTLSAPTHYSTHGFLDLAMAGLGWAMTPLSAAQPHLRDGTLVELIRGSRMDVPLYWQHLRLGTAVLAGLTDAVRAAAGKELVKVAG